LKWRAAPRPSQSTPANGNETDTFEKHTHDEATPVRNPRFRRRPDPGQRPRLRSGRRQARFSLPERISLRKHGIDNMARKLLVADDALIIREMIKDAAQEAGWEIVGEAEDGQAAIEQYKDLNPDAVTLDLVMPQYDGLHALRGIMNDDPSAKVLVVSALEQKTVLRDAFRLGAADFIVKPFDKNNLLGTLDQMVPAETAGVSS
jgi:two-component system chemotaxis response regulator CheY